MTLSYRNGVSIAELVVYVPSLAIAAFLAFRHGFGRNSGWLFLIIFCVARIIGPAMQLATINAPTSQALYTGSTILQTIGLSPLQLAAIGLLSRVLESINKTRHTLVNTKVLKFVELLITVALILGIVGGIDASDNLETTGVYKLGTKSKVATALFVVSYVAIVIITIITSFSISHAEPGEKRILLAVAISLPFLLIRLVYSIMSGLAGDKHFNLITGSVTILLCVALIEEFIVVVIYESVGLTLRQVPKNQHVQGYAHEAQPLPGTPSSGAQYRQQPVQGNRALRIAKKTIIGRIVMAFIPKGRDSDVEMHQQNYVQK